jgi:hypothetical protein
MEAECLLSEWLERQDATIFIYPCPSPRETLRSSGFFTFLQVELGLLIGHLGSHDWKAVYH